MYTVMCLQMFQLHECFITHITAIWTLTSMYTLIYLQMSQLLECFITHITATWTLTSVYTFIFIFPLSLNVSLHLSQPYGHSPACTC